MTNGGTISSGTTAIITNPATSITGAITNDGSLQFWQSTSLSNGFVISGAGSVSQRGSGTTVLSGANTYAGGTTNSAGTLSVGSSSALGTGTLTMNGGTLGVTGGGGWTLTNAVSLSANSLADTGGGNLTLSGTVSGTGSLNNGWNNNTLTLSGTYAATGDLFAVQGRINFSGTQTGGGNLDVQNNAIINNTGTLNITNAGKQLKVGGWGGTTTMAVFNNNTNGVVNQSGSASFCIGKGGPGTYNNSGGTTTVSNTSLLSIGLEGNRGDLTSGTNTLNVNAGTFTVTAAVPFIYLGGTGANTTNSTGVINLNGGTFATATRISKWQGTNSGTGNSATVNFNGGTLRGTANNLTLLGTDLTAVNIRTNGATVDVGSGLTATISANLLDGGGNGGLTKTSAGTLILSGANTYAGGTMNSAGTLSVGSSSALGTGTLTMNGGTLGVTGGGGWTLTNAVTLSANSTADTGGGNLTLGGTISGTGSLNKGNNNNTLTLSGTYAATGDLWAGQGTINFSGTQTGGGNLDVQNNAIINNTGTLNITNAGKQLKVGGWGGNGTVAVFNNNTNGVVNQSGFGSFTIGKAGAGTYNNSGGTTTVSNTALLSIGLEGNGAATSGTSTLNVNAGTFTVTAAVPVIYLGGTGANTTNSAGVINLNGGTFATATRISKWLGTNSGTGNSATVNFNGGTLRGTANNLTLLGTDLTAVNIRTNGATVDVGAGLTNTISANLLDGGGNGGLTKTGAGTLVLSGANTYTGATTVSGGTLLATNSTLTATITSSNLTIAFASSPSVGTYTVLPGSVGSASLANTSVTGLGGKTATVSNTTNLVVQVAKTTPSLSGLSATAITYGQALSNSVISGTALHGTNSVAGTFTFSSPATTPSAGTASQNVTFTPTDSSSYNIATTTVSVAVNKATPTISVAPTASAITYGQTLASSSLTGGSASTAGSFAFTLPSTAPNAGTASQGVTFTPTDTANFNTATTTVSVTVNAASLGSGDITLSPVGNGSYTASASGVSGFSYSYAGRNTNGITTIYGPSSSAPSAAGYYTVTATSSDSNYTGSKSANYFIAGPVPVADSLVIPTGNSTFGIPLASLLQNDRRIDASGNVQSDNLSISGVSGANLSGVMVNYSVAGEGAQGFSYTLADASAGQNATGTVTLTAQSAATPFNLAGTPGTPSYDGFMTTVTVTFSGTAYQTYYVYYKGNLPDAVWKSVGGVYSENGTFSVDISEEGNHVSDWGTSMFFQGVK